MSTNAQIAFYESKEQAQNIDDFDASILVYWDGYPETKEGVPARIVPFLKKFMKRRGLSDSSYAGAWTLHELVAQHVKRQKEFYREHPAHKNSGLTYADGKDCPSFGIMKEVGSVDFFYKVYPDVLEIWQREWDYSRGKSNFENPKYKFVKAIDLTRKFVIPK